MSHINPFQGRSPPVHGDLGKWWWKGAAWETLKLHLSPPLCLTSTHSRAGVPQCMGIWVNDGRREQRKRAAPWPGTELEQSTRTQSLWAVETRPTHDGESQVQWSVTQHRCECVVGGRKSKTAFYPRLPWFRSEMSFLIFVFDLIQKKVGKSFEVTVIGDDFRNRPLLVWPLRTIQTWHLMKMRGFFTAKDKVAVHRKEEIFTDCTCGIGICVRVCNPI